MKKVCFVLAILLSLAGAMVAQRFKKGEIVSQPIPCQFTFDSSTTIQVFRASNKSGNDNIGPQPSTDNGRQNRPYSLLELERLGRVPDDANERTWRLCEKTSWWGRRLDPDAFWSNRVVWLSREAEDEANRHGRRYPPIPSGNSMFLDRNDTDVTKPFTTWEFRDRSYCSSSREHVYWCWRETHEPIPPEKIQFGLESISSEWKDMQNSSSHQFSGKKMPLQTQEELLAGLVSRFQGLGFPNEALSKEVLDWEYVRCKREEINRIDHEPDDFRRTMLLEEFNQHLACPSTLVESDPTDEEFRVTRGWRIDYLRRLRREGTDESYIEAYKKAWNLSEADLREDVKE